MNLTVSTRIIGSFAVLMVFTAALLTTGLWGITHINLGVNNLTNKAIPLTINIDHMSTGLLQAKVDLMDYQNTLKSSEAMALEQKFTKEKTITLNAKATLLKLASDNKDLLAIMKEIDSLSTSVYSMSDELIIEHNNVISMTERSAKLNRQSIDAMDNTISKATDIQVVVTGAQREQVSAFIGELEKLSASIKKAMDNSIPAAIVGLRMQSKSKLNQLDKTIINIGSMGDAAKNQQLLKAYENFKEVTFSDSGLLNNQVELLRLKKQNSEDFIKLNEKLLKTSQALKSAEEFIVSLAKTIATDAEDTVSSSRTVLISAGIIALIASMLIATAVIRSIIKPLDTIVSVVTEIASGDLTKTFNDTQQDEFGHLSKNLNKLVSNLRIIIQELNNNSQHLSATAQQTSVASRTTFNNIHHQKEQTDMIAAAVEEMAATVDEVAKSAANTLKEVELAHTKVKQGEKVITDNISSITTLAQDIEHSAEVIEKLNQRSNDIGGVLDVIRSVAEQTNLLALNAAIEAARAGEQGRGFAVVADEVRTLASRAQQSTAEIQEMIQQLQTGANHAVETMNNSRKQAQLRVESIAGAGKVLESISASVTTIKDMSYQIATASEEQSSTTREQNRNIVAIVDAAEKTAATAQENQKASENLAYMANEQLKMIQHFKI